MTDKMAESPQMPTPGFTLYSVESARDEQRRQQSRSHSLWWALIAVAIVIIAAMIYLLVAEGLI